ncbi:MAG: hypothetical protein R3C44_24340 [Chloroflexota bacterium]
MNVEITGNSVFQNHGDYGIYSSAGGGATINLVAENSQFYDNQYGVFIIDSNSAEQNFDVNNNTFLRHERGGVSADLTAGADASAILNGFITGKTIGDNTANSGVSLGYGITVTASNGLGTLSIDVSDNIIQKTFAQGIWVDSHFSAASGSASLIMDNNTILVPSGAGVAGVRLRARTAGTLCADVTNNASTGNAYDDFEALQEDTSVFHLQGFTTDVATTYSNNGNTGSVFSSGTFSGATCATPTAVVVAAPSPTTVATAVEDTFLVARSGYGISSATMAFAGGKPLMETAATPSSVGTVDLSLGDLNPGQAVTIIFDVIINDPLSSQASEVCNQGMITASNQNFILTDDPDDPTSSQDPTCTPLDSAVDLQLIKNDNVSSVAPGDPIVYTLTATNISSTIATGVVFTDTVPANTTFNAGSSTPGWVCSPDGNPGSACTFDYGASADIAPNGGTGVVDFSVTVDGSLPGNVTEITNTAEVGDDGSHGPDPTPGDNSDTATTPVVRVSACPVSPTEGTVGSSTTFLLGTGMGSPNRTRMASKITIPNASATTALYGQMAAKAHYGVKYVRFIYPNKTYEEIQPETDQGDSGAISWWGADLDVSRLTRPFIKGRWFLYSGAKRDRLPRALVLYVTQTTAEEYASNWSTFTYPDNFVAGASEFEQSNTNILPIPEIQATTDVTVQVAIADINKDPRTIDLMVSAGGVSETVTLSGPVNAKMQLLNLVEVTLEDVPAGTDQVEILMESALDAGDSAALLGAAASYGCDLP